MFVYEFVRFIANKSVVIVQSLVKWKRLQSKRMKVKEWQRSKRCDCERN